MSDAYERWKEIRKAFDELVFSLYGTDALGMPTVDEAINNMQGLLDACGKKIEDKPTIELKPCPFCGCEMECYLDTYGGLAGGWNLRGVHKENCIMKQVHIINTSKNEGLIEGWNMRVNE